MNERTNKRMNKWSDRKRQQHKNGEERNWLGRRTERIKQKWRSHQVNRDNQADDQLLRWQVCPCHKTEWPGRCGVVAWGQLWPQVPKPQGTWGRTWGLPATGASWHSVCGLEQGQTEGAYLRVGWIFLLQSKNIFFLFLKEMTHLEEAFISSRRMHSCVFLGFSGSWGVTWGRKQARSPAQSSCNILWARCLYQRPHEVRRTWLRSLERRSSLVFRRVLLAFARVCDWGKWHNSVGHPCSHL